MEKASCDVLIRVRGALIANIIAPPETIANRSRGSTAQPCVTRPSMRFVIGEDAKIEDWLAEGSRFELSGDFVSTRLRRCKLRDDHRARPFCRDVIKSPS
jgi:hypothetical protein